MIGLSHRGRMGLPEAVAPRSRGTVKSLWKD